VGVGEGIDDLRPSPPTRSFRRFSMTGRVAIISLRQVSKRYRGDSRRSDWSVSRSSRGRCFPHRPLRCRKTTLLKLIAAIERANGGAVLVNGQNLGLRPAAIPYLRRNLGLVFQGRSCSSTGAYRQCDAAADRYRAALPRAARRHVPRSTRSACSARESHPVALSAASSSACASRARW